MKMKCCPNHGCESYHRASKLSCSILNQSCEVTDDCKSRILFCYNTQFRVICFYFPLEELGLNVFISFMFGFAYSLNHRAIESLIAVSIGYIQTARRNSSKPLQIGKNKFTKFFYVVKLFNFRVLLHLLHYSFQQYLYNLRSNPSNTNLLNECSRPRRD